jgi:hypothetical protein
MVSNLPNTISFERGKPEADRAPQSVWGDLGSLFVRPGLGFTALCSITERLEFDARAAHFKASPRELHSERGREEDALPHLPAQTGSRKLAKRVHGASSKTPDVHLTQSSLPVC